MNLIRPLRDIAQNEDLNFLLTNRVPRIALTHFVGWWSRIRHPWVRDLSLAVWKLFSDLDLSEAREQRFASLHDCFIRELKPGLRPVDTRPEVISSPSDADKSAGPMNTPSTPSVAAMASRLSSASWLSACTSRQICALASLA